jgi:hypothetical protein
VGLFVDHLEASNSAALGPAYIAIPEGAPVSALTESERPAWRRPRLLRSNILARSYSAITPWTWSKGSSSAVPRGAVQESDFSARTTKLVDQKHLMGIAARQPIWGKDINALDIAACNCAPEPL